MIEQRKENNGKHLGEASKNLTSGGVLSWVNSRRMQGNLVFKKESKSRICVEEVRGERVNRGRGERGGNK